MGFGLRTARSTLPPDESGMESVDLSASTDEASQKINIYTAALREVTPPPTTTPFPPSSVSARLRPARVLNTATPRMCPCAGPSTPQRPRTAVARNRAHCQPLPPSLTRRPRTTCAHPLPPTGQDRGFFCARARHARSAQGQHPHPHQRSSLPPQDVQEMLQGPPSQLLAARPRARVWPGVGAKGVDDVGGVAWHGGCARQARPRCSARSTAASAWAARTARHRVTTVLTPMLVPTRAVVRGAWCGTTPQGGEFVDWLIKNAQCASRVEASTPPPPPPPPHTHPRSLSFSRSYPLVHAHARTHTHTHAPRARVKKSGPRCVSACSRLSHLSRPFNTRDE